MSWLRKVVIAYFAHFYAWRLHKRNGVSAAVDNEMDYFCYSVSILPGATIFVVSAALYDSFVGAYPAPAWITIVLLAAIIVPTLLVLSICKTEKSRIRSTGHSIATSSSRAPLDSLLITLAPILFTLIASMFLF